MQILHWNIQQGGGTRRTPGIALHLLASRADAIALTEFRRSMGGQLAATLSDHGWRYQLCTDPPLGKNGTLLCARAPLKPGSPPPCPELRHRWLDATLDQGIRVTALHLPDARSTRGEAGRRKAAAWHALLGELHAAPSDEPRLIIGDLNTGRHHLDEPGSRFTCTALLGKLSALGYQDAYRITNPAGRAISWVSHAGNGFRLDTAVVSRKIVPLVRTLEYDQSPRLEGLSDHAPVRLTLQKPVKSSEPAA